MYSAGQIYVLNSLEVERGKKVERKKVLGWLNIRLSQRRIAVSQWSSIKNLKYSRFVCVSDLTLFVSSSRSIINIFYLHKLSDELRTQRSRDETPYLLFEFSWAMDLYSQLNISILLDMLHLHSFIAPFIGILYITYVYI